MATTSSAPAAAPSFKPDIARTWMNVVNGLGALVASVWAYTIVQNGLHLPLVTVISTMTPDAQVTLIKAAMILFGVTGSRAMVQLISAPGGASLQRMIVYIVIGVIAVAVGVGCTVPFVALGPALVVIFAAAAADAIYVLLT